VADFSAKSINLTWLFLPDERDQIKKNRPDAKFEETQGIGGYIYLRADKPPFNDKRVRQAISMGINRKAIRDAITKGEGVPDQMLFVGYPFSRQVKDLGPSAKYWDYNPTAARQLLDAAIGAGKNIDTTWDHADAVVYTQAYVDTSTLTQAQLKQIGINITDKQAPYAQYISTTYQGQYEGMGHSPRAVFYFLDYLSERLSFKDGKRGRINLSYVNNPTLEALLDKQRGQFTLQERLATIKDIETLVAEEQYEIYWSTDTRTYFWDADITNYRPTAWFPYTHLMKAWRDKA
jgi:peptide/nickel transport system substrate-binding protein